MSDGPSMSIIKEQQVSNQEHYVSNLTLNEIKKKRRKTVKKVTEWIVHKQLASRHREYSKL